MFLLHFTFSGQRDAKAGPGTAMLECHTEPGLSDLLTALPQHHLTDTVPLLLPVTVMVAPGKWRCFLAGNTDLPPRVAGNRTRVLEGSPHNGGHARGELQTSPQ